MDNPMVAAGDTSLPVTAWEAPDVDGGEDQAVRREREAAAVEVCVDCPVMVQCMAFGASVNAAGKLAVPHGILGGMTALERHKALVRERQVEPAPVEPAPDHELRTEQKLAFLRALAAHESAGEVAAAAGMDVRKAAWHRSRITTQLGLEKSASRGEVLAAAVARGLLRAEEVVVDPEPVAPVSVGVRPVQLSLDDALDGASVTDLFAPQTVLGVAA
ncbi:MAG: hypothetical protein HOY79_04525 [Streptomyces sp.]|nr:hypothetical protein [Streptomyces sp.]